MLVVSLSSGPPLSLSGFRLAFKPLSVRQVISHLIKGSKTGSFPTLQEKFGFLRKCIKAVFVKCLR